MKWYFESYVISRAPKGFCETIEFTFGVCVCLCVCPRHIAHSYWPILMKLRMEIPGQQIEHTSKVKVTKNKKATVWDRTFEPEVVETSGWFQNVPDRNTNQKYSAHGVPFLRHVTSNKHTIVACFLNSSILCQLISKSVHTLIGPMLCIKQKCTNQNYVTRVSMATKYPIIKHIVFF